MTEETKEQKQTEEPKTPDKVVQESKQLLEQMKREREALQIERAEIENLKAEQLVSGQSLAGKPTPEEPREETPKEYKDRVMRGEL